MGVSDNPQHGGADFGAALTTGERRFKKFSKLIVGDLILRVFVRLEPVDHHNIPLSGPVIIAPSHRSNIDTPLIGAATDRDSRFMAKDSIFKSPFWTKFLVALGGFPVKRGSLDRESLNNALAILARGEMLVVFPEGARQEGPRIKPVFEGALWLAARAGTPIVPVGIGGSRAAMPIGVKLPRPKKVVVVFGEPLIVGDPDKPGRVPRAKLEEAAVDLRERLQLLYDEAQKRAGTPNRPWSPDEPGINERIEPWAE